MSEDTAAILRKILETFVSRVDAMNTALTELRIAISGLANTQAQTVEKLDNIRLELRELATRIEMAMRK